MSLPAPLLAYLQKVREIRSTGGATPESTYYPALDGLLNGVGDTLRPRVHAVGPISTEKGEVYPDGGLYTSHQLQEGDPIRGVKPIRGVVEVKAPDIPIERLLDPSTKEGKQVEGYRKKYRGVLVTNLREFAYVTTTAGEVHRDRRGESDLRERFVLAESEQAFWALASNPSSLDSEVAFQFTEFLSRALKFNVPITEPKDLAAYLASYAREARLHLDQADLSRLAPLRTSIEETLGVKFKGAPGERFFKATVVQSLFYGLFSAWTLWMRDPEVKPTEMDFSWSTAGFHLRVPMIQALFSEVTKPGTVQALDLRPQIARAAATLNRVQHTELFSKFEDREAIGYFYEWFLEAYDPVLREEYGVWYTPPKLVRYMVERVDTVLREELDRPLGFADPDVYVLDPACGTGSYLTAVLDRIAETLKGNDLVGATLKEAVTKRLFGFEILTAPFVVAHLMIGLYLRERGIMLGDKERAQVILSNALAPATGQRSLPIPEFEEEREAADRVKRRAPILVVIGNPPYDANTSVPIEEERKRLDIYKETKRAVARGGRGANDLYVRFMRMAEETVVSGPPGHGVVCFVTNYLWLDGDSHVGMRERYLEAYSQVWIDNLHGDSRETGKKTPEGLRDPSVFSLGGNKEGIQKGTAVSLLLRRKEELEGDDARVFYRDWWGEGKLDELEAHGPLITGTDGYRLLNPKVELGFPFLHRQMGDAYLDWPTIQDLFAFSSPGVITARDDLLVEHRKEVLERKMKVYFDPDIPFEQLGALSHSAIKETKRFPARSVRSELLSRGFLEHRVVQYLFRPFDSRYLYWEPETKLVEEKRPDIAPHLRPGNVWFTAARRERKGFSPPVVTGALTAFHNVGSGAHCFPLYVDPGADIFGGDEDRQTSTSSGLVPNLTTKARAYLHRLGIQESSPEALYYHAIATLHSPAYAEDHKGGLRQDWPRVPLPKDAAPLLRSAELGRRVAALLNVGMEVEGVTTGRLRDALSVVARVVHAGGEEPDEASRHFMLAVRWGRSGQPGVVMPGPGRTQRRTFSAAEIEAMGEAADVLGPETRDVYLNDDVFWQNVPERVWDYTIGGYQALKKWLSYREQEVLGRDLDIGEVRHFQQTARRIGALLLLEKDLDENYSALTAPESGGVEEPASEYITSTGGVIA